MEKKIPINKKHVTSHSTFSNTVLTKENDVLPFAIPELNLRGRIVHLDNVIQNILKSHCYPEPIAYLLAQFITLTSLLGTSLNTSRRFTLQTKSDGVVNLLVCDFHSPSSIRAYAQFDQEKLNTSKINFLENPKDLLGNGTLSLIVDSNAQSEPYQGIVAISGSGLEDLAESYFSMSEQIPTLIRLCTSFHKIDSSSEESVLRAGGLLIQYLPRSHVKNDLPSFYTQENSDAWVEAKSLVKTVHCDELTDPNVPVEKLLFRLFHQHDIRIFTPQPILAQCSCSKEKIQKILENFSEKDLIECTENKLITITCEFCSNSYSFDPNDFGRKDR